jgi:hypothetical protein
MKITDSAYGKLSAAFLRIAFGTSTHLVITGQVRL